MTSDLTRMSMSDEQRLRKSLDELTAPPCVDYGLALHAVATGYKVTAYWRIRPTVCETLDFEAGELVNWQEFVKRFNIKVRKQKDIEMSNTGVTVSNAPQSSLDKQVGGEHYKRLKLQPWQIIDALGLDFYDGNALKYLLRWRTKGGVEDLKKAIHYIEHQIEKQNAATE